MIDWPSVKQLAVKLFDEALLATIDFLVEHAEPSLNREAERMRQIEAAQWHDVSLPEGFVPPEGGFLYWTDRRSDGEAPPEVRGL